MHFFSLDEMHHGMPNSLVFIHPHCRAWKEKNHHPINTRDSNCLKRYVGRCFHWMNAWWNEQNPLFFHPHCGTWDLKEENHHPSGQVNVFFFGWIYDPLFISQLVGISLCMHCIHVWMYIVRTYSFPYFKHILHIRIFIIYKDISRRVLYCVLYCIYTFKYI
jgi:hypothetical protein